MIHLHFVPSQFQYVAVSGGIDSMVLYDFIKRHKKTILHFNHGTEFGKEAQEFVCDYASKYKHPIELGKISRPKLKSESWEEYWRNERYKFFDKFKGSIALAHHLDDAVETYLFNMIHGNSWLMPASRGNVVRPFIITKKDKITSWADNHGIDFLDDPSNKNNKYSRSIIRNEMMKHVLKINPGIHTVLIKKYKEATWLKSA